MLKHEAHLIIHAFSRFCELQLVFSLRNSQQNSFRTNYKSIAAEGSILIFTVFLWYPVLLAELYRVDVISIFALIQGGPGGGLSFWKYSPNGTSHVRLNV